jgi:hypothetical protein
MSEVAQPAHQTPRLLFNKRLDLCGGCRTAELRSAGRVRAPAPTCAVVIETVCVARTPPSGWASAARRSTAPRNTSVCRGNGASRSLRRDPLWFVAKFLQRVSGNLIELGALCGAHCSLPTGDSFELWRFRGESLLEQSLLAGKQRAAIKSAA